MKVHLNQKEVEKGQLAEDRACCPSSTTTLKSEESCCEQAANGASCCDKSLSKEVNSKAHSCC